MIDHTLAVADGYLRGKYRGYRYHRRGGRPNPYVPDDVLADRIRSELGPREKRLDIPRVHAMVEDHVALLHGEVPTDADADDIERAVARMSGVLGVESYLHVGLGKVGARPSDGRAVHPPSHALEHLLAAAQRAGDSDEAARPAVRAVLATLVARLPPGERDHLVSHLPADVRAFASLPRRHGAPARRLRHRSEFVAAVVTADALDPDRADQVVSAVLSALRELVPEEAADVAAVLPRELRALWTASAPGNDESEETTVDSS